MLFTSLSYAVFLAAVFILYWAVPHRFRWSLLLASSLYFYTTFGLKFVLVLATTTAVTYLCAILLERSRDVRHKRLWLACAVVLCAGLLLFFKYFVFISESVSALLSVFTIQMDPLMLKLAAPVGISFYTFKSISYIADVYKGRMPAERHFGVFATYISFFAEIQSGPIDRGTNLIPQLKTEKHFDYSQATYGLKLIALGLFKKMIISDNLGAIVDSVFGDVTSYSGFSLLVAAVFYSFQIYTNFSGYSDIAIGSAKLMGIDLTTNFNAPYLSASVKEFWSRWHITLSTWLRDYIYIPLGGNRRGALRKSLNIIITFLVSGLWHGANWTFIIWGGLHGTAQVLENTIQNKITPHAARDGAAEKPRMAAFKRLLSICVVFVFATIAWVFFRANSVHDALYVLRHLVDGVTSPVAYLKDAWAALGFDYRSFFISAFCIAATVAYDCLLRKGDPLVMLKKLPLFARWAIYYAVIIIFFLLLPAKASGFIYFEF